MNTRGLVSLIVLNIGLDLQILSTKIFTIMVIMALITTFLTSPLLYYLYQKPYHQELAKRHASGNQTTKDNVVEEQEKIRNEDVSLPEIVVPSEDTSHDQDTISSSNHR
jgi:hypothetical protein